MQLIHSPIARFHFAESADGLVRIVEKQLTDVIAYVECDQGKPLD
jgi:hypothetical protein